MERCRPSAPGVGAVNAFLPVGAQFRPDKIYIGYGNFLDMSFDINGRTDYEYRFQVFRR